MPLGNPFQVSVLLPPPPGKPPEVALTAAPLNDPAEESAQDEDGTCFWSENARIYADSTELTADTPVNALVFESLEGPIFRGTGMDTRVEDLLQSYWSEQVALLGCRVEQNHFLDAVFRFQGRGAAVDKCAFQIRATERYYALGSNGYAVDMEGKKLEKTGRKCQAQQ